MSVVTRFAPSPTGFLHIGNVRTALVAWLFARSQNGKFILRIDDTDIKRSEERFTDGIKRDLEWLGLTWDAEFRQSDRIERYKIIQAQLISEGRLYPCYETQEELEVKKKIALNSGKPPIYDRTALRLSNAEKQRLEASGIRPHWRFLLNAESIDWQDLVRDHIHFEAAHLGDPVWIREDGTMTYSIASVIDDIDYGITHIVRGEDHISNSALHVQLFKALGHEPPEFAHLALLKSKEGEMSKRTGGHDIQALREQGIEPLALLSLLAKIGTSDSIELRSTHKELITDFSISKLGKATVLYDPQELWRLNARLLHNMPFSQVKSRNIADFDEPFWEAVKHNIKSISEAKEWHNMCHGDITPIIEEPEFIHTSATLLPEGAVGPNTWADWTAVIKQKTGRTGKALFMPLRLALTGIAHGPELADLLPLIGRDKVLSRLTKQSR